MAAAMEAGFFHIIPGRGGDDRGDQLAWACVTRPGAVTARWEGMNQKNMSLLDTSMV